MKLVFPSFFPSAFHPARDQARTPPPSVPTQPNISPFPTFFSLTSNSPLLTYPPSSLFTSQLLFLSPLSHRRHLPSFFSFSFFNSSFLFFPPHSGQVASFTGPPASWVHLLAVQEKEGLPALTRSTGWAFPAGIAAEMSVTPQCPELQHS